MKNLCEEFDTKLHFIDNLELLKPDSFNFIDVGADGQHPGPKQQKAFAETFYDKIQNN